MQFFKSYMFIRGYENRYSIDKSGNIFSHLSNKYLKPQIDTHGRKMVILSNHEKKRKSFAVHRLVAENYIENLNNLPEVNHIDGDCLNNEVNNLEWCTRSDNLKHAYKNNLRPRLSGERNPSSKLSKKDVDEIRQLHKVGVKQKEILKKFDISHDTHYKIVNYLTWK